VIDRKPPARMLAHTQTLAGKTLHLAPVDWDRLSDLAAQRGFETLVMARRLLLYAMELIEEEARRESFTRMPRGNVRDSRGTRGF
jgi:hypothetical protein